MTQRYSLTRSLGALGVILALVGLVSQGTASAQTPLAELRILADQGNALAQYDLGLMYGRGEDVAQDFTQAVFWYRKSAEQGNVRAQFNLGLSYGTGRGVSQDHVEALKWFNLAASRVTGDAKKRYTEGRDVLRASMTPSQIAEAQRLAGEWQAAFEKKQTD